MARILVVEDNRRNARLVRATLERSGCEILEAPTAEEGIRLARTTRPDLILMDIQLAGMDGCEATRLLKAWPETRDIPVVALTALAMPADRARVLASGCAKLVIKPAGPVEIRDAVFGLLDRASRTRSAA